VSQNSTWPVFQYGSAQFHSHLVCERVICCHNPKHTSIRTAAQQRRRYLHTVRPPVLSSQFRSPLHTECLRLGKAPHTQVRRDALRNAERLFNSGTTLNSAAIAMPTPARKLISATGPTFCLTVCNPRLSKGEAFWKTSSTSGDTLDLYEGTYTIGARHPYYSCPEVPSLQPPTMSCTSWELSSSADLHHRGSNIRMIHAWHSKHAKNFAKRANHMILPCAHATNWEDICCFPKDDRFPRLLRSSKGGNPISLVLRHGILTGWIRERRMGVDSVGISRVMLRVARECGE